MNKSSISSCLIGLIRISIAMPIWYYLMYQILIRIEATELMMFLFWIWLPLNVILAIIEIGAKEILKK